MLEGKIKFALAVAWHAEYKKCTRSRSTRCKMRQVFEETTFQKFTRPFSMKRLDEGNEAVESHHK